MSKTEDNELEQVEAERELDETGELVENGDEKDQGYLRFKRSHLYALAIPLTFVVGLAVGYLFWGRPTETAPTAAQVADPPAAAQQEPSGPTRFDISVDDDPSLGPEDAPITIVEFSDYNCPFCQKWHVETFNQLMAAYPDQIRFVYRDLPVVGGGTVGLGAAIAANCAGEQDAYWDYHQALFSGQNAMDSQGFLQYAADLNLDQDAFQECVEDERNAQEVENDLRYGASLGITGTPTFFINGIPVVGAQPLQVFINVIESELNS
jgi:protein-disulfide isomerase